MRENSFSHLTVKNKVAGTGKATLWSGRDKSEELQPSKDGRAKRWKEPEFWIGCQAI